MCVCVCVCVCVCLRVPACVCVCVIIIIISPGKLFIPALTDVFSTKLERQQVSSGHSSVFWSILIML